MICGLHMENVTPGEGRGMLQSRKADVVLLTGCSGCPDCVENTDVEGKSTFINFPAGSYKGSVISPNPSRCFTSFDHSSRRACQIRVSLMY